MAARRNARLWKGEDISGLLLDRNGHPTPKYAGGNCTHK